MRVKNHPILAIGAMTAAAALALTGCSAGGSSDSGDSGKSGSTTLTVWVDADRASVMKDAAAAFTKESGVKVKLVQKDFGKIQDEFVQQVPTGKGPDITIAAHDWLGNFVTNGVVQPIELGDTAGDFQEIAINAMSYEGQTYGLPYSIENIALLRNTDLAPKAPTSYDEMVQMGKDAGTEFPFLVQVGEQSDPYHLYPFQTSFGAPVFGTNDDGSYNPEDLQIGNEGGVKFANWLAEQGKAGLLKTTIDGDIAKEKFVSGASPFLITGPWNVQAAQDAGINLAVDPIPSAGGQDAQPFVGVQGFVISAKSKNVLAATEFLTNYIGTKDVQVDLYNVGKRAPALTAAFEEVSSNPITAAFGKVGANGVPMPSIPEMGAVWQYWGVTEADIINGKGDPTALWQKMADDIKAAIEG
ncbi:carbohydrate ABC transporter substrate-binding protein, CUT1 family [Paramicrobacterium humi]|uniref:Carbohydrate ABC transporter substrate-binding protein, CUT1 family n=1 Tax=Paramicrobacterium humi TaxID=640635 RepID=A0A1H4JBA5_9MICO|nr:maltose ABC transporter substrate-binding protein [Microbacterium humi]SEB43511.1 carbohydrate ABC transporter substrate-binding protein, CUT1 family [Microbacterium humi]